MQPMKAVPMLWVMVVLIACGLMVGCDEPFHEQVDNGLAISQVAIVAAQEQFDYHVRCKEGELDPETGINISIRECVVVYQAGAAHNFIVTALDIYCDGPGDSETKSWRDGGPCSPPKKDIKQAQARIRGLLTSYAEVMASLETLVNAAKLKPDIVPGQVQLIPDVGAAVEGAQL